MAVDGVDGAQTEGLDGLDTGEVHFRKSGLGGNQPAPSGRRRLLPRALSIILPLIPARREGRGSKHGNKHCDRRPSNAHGVTVPQANGIAENATRSEEHTSELQSLMRTSYAVFCLK